MMRAQSSHLSLALLLILAVGCRAEDYDFFYLVLQVRVPPYMRMEFSSVVAEILLLSM